MTQRLMTTIPLLNNCPIKKQFLSNFADFFFKLSALKQLKAFFFFILPVEQNLI